MSRIEKAVKEVSDLRDFYLKIRKRKQPGYSQRPHDSKSSSIAVKEDRPQKKSS